MLENLVQKKQQPGTIAEGGGDDGGTEGVRTSGFDTLGGLIAAMKVAPPLWLAPLSRPVSKPGTSVEDLESPDAKIYFHGAISAAEAQARVRKPGLDDGRFLVWSEPSKLGTYGLCVVTRGKMKYHTIKKVAPGRLLSVFGPLPAFGWLSSCEVS